MDFKILGLALNNMKKIEMHQRSLPNLRFLSDLSAISRTYSQKSHKYVLITIFSCERCVVMMNKIPYRPDMIGKLF